MHSKVRSHCYSVIYSSLCSKQRNNKSPKTIKKETWILSVVGTTVDEEAGINGIGGTIKEEKVPLLKAQEIPEIKRNNWIPKALGQTCKTTTHLANHLATGTVLAYQVLSPIFKIGGRCGFATTNGFWIMDGTSILPNERSKSYRLQFIDFEHAIMTFLVFGAAVMFDQNVVYCFFPQPSAEVAELLTALPVVVGVFCSMMFSTFPTTRHGIGFPLSLLFAK